jgi:hypothetical protein
MLLDSRFWSYLATAALVAIMAGTPIIMSSVMDRGHEIPKSAFAEPLAFLALGAFMIAGHWWKAAARQAYVIPALACMIVFLLLAGFSSAISDIPSVAIFGSYYRREGLLAWMSYAAVFASIIVLGSSLERRKDLLDVMILTSIVPCSYALLQRIDLDIFRYIGHEIDRPMGTLGNPLFLGAYLGILLPLSIVRIWASSWRSVSFPLWAFLAVLQAITLFLTQSRGPILAFLAVSLGLLCVIGAHERSRRMFVLAALIFLSISTSVVLINVSENAGKIAQQTPVISRLVYSSNKGASIGTQKGSGSMTTRLSVLQAGVETFIDAPLVNQLIGFAPDSAYVHFFPHMPNSAMQTEGYWQSNSFDRLHADTLDIGLNFGLLGWLSYCSFFCLVFYAATSALFGRIGAVTPWSFSLFVAVGGATSAALAISAGIPYAAAPAFGLGIGGGWLLYIVYCAWRLLRSTEPDTSAEATSHWKLLAGLTASLLVFWVDAQINIPVHTTRIFSFAIAALILVVASSIVRSGNEPNGSTPDTQGRFAVWGLAFALVATCASLLPSVRFDGFLAIKEAERWWIGGLPVAMLVVCGAIYSGLVRTESPSQPYPWPRKQWIVLVIGLPTLYAFLHWLTIATVGNEVGLGIANRIIGTVGLVHIFIIALCVAAARQMYRSNIADADDGLARGIQRYFALAIFGFALLASSFGWKAIRADVNSTFAGWVSEKQPEISDEVLLKAIDAIPHERQYQRQRTFIFLGRALADISKTEPTPENFPKIKQSLDVAEQQARQSLSTFPKDPWIILALANALQIRALANLRPMAPEAGLAAAQEADQLFASAYEIFPNQPLLLRNWAQLRFNEGDFWGAFRLIDRMEEVIPAELEPYAERIALAQRINELDVVHETLVRAESRLDSHRMEQLRTVAGLQHEK